MRGNSKNARYYVQTGAVFAKGCAPFVLEGFGDQLRGPAAGGQGNRSAGAGRQRTGCAGYWMRPSGKAAVTVLKGREPEKKSGF
jgi:hypothetical protein